MNRCFRNLVFSAVLAAVGCQRPGAQLAPPELTVVPVSKPVQRPVTDYVDFTGRTDAVQSVDIRARVTGYLIRMPFKEGTEVRGDDRLHGAAREVGLLAAPLGQGPLLAATALFPGRCEDADLLFEIDPRPYQAQYDQAQSQVALNQAQYALAKVTYDRDVPLAATRAVSQLQLDQDKAAMDEAEATIKATEAATEVYKLNLSFTQVRSPIDGQVSRFYLTAGNLVSQDNTLLTTVVSPDPMYVYFDMDEPTLLNIRRAVNEGRIKRPQDGVFPVLMGLQGEEGYPHKGNINFVNNQVNPTTGSISLRGVFPNPKPPEGARLLSPGMFVRIRLPIGQPYSALLVIDRALGSDQGIKYVYVVDGENKIQTRRITTGPLQEDGLRVIEKGLNADDWVVVGALPQIRPRQEVKPDPTAMPTMGPAGPGQAPPAESGQPPPASSGETKP